MGERRNKDETPWPLLFEDDHAITEIVSRLRGEHHAMETVTMTVVRYSEPSVIRRWDGEDNLPNLTLLHHW